MNNSYIRSLRRSLLVGVTGLATGLTASAQSLTNALPYVPLASVRVAPTDQAPPVPPAAISVAPKAVEVPASAVQSRQPLEVPGTAIRTYAPGTVSGVPYVPPSLIQVVVPPG